MGFWDHLEELRGTIIKSVIAFVFFAVLIGYFIKEFNQVLLWPLLNVTAEFPHLTVELGTTTPLEVFNMIIQMCFLGGLTLAGPFILFFIGQFVAPALTEKESKIILPLCLSAMFLFLLGAAFSFFALVPSTIRMAIELNDTFHLAFRWTVGAYYSLLMWLVLGVGVAFEFPLVIVLLLRGGGGGRHAIVVIFVVAAIVTPTPDPLTQSLFALPLYVLYEIAIIISTRIEKRRAVV